MDRKLILTLIISVFFSNAFGQLLKVRVGANGSMFQKEVGSPEVEHTGMQLLYAPDYSYTDFTSNLDVGFEAEAMLLWTPHIETGLEFEYSKMSGDNDTPPYSNYIITLNYDVANNSANVPPLKPFSYETSVLSTVLNLRYYLLPEETIDPFFKVFGGISFVGTDFNYKDPADIVMMSDPTGTKTDGERVGFSMGTQDSSDPREPALYYGAGAGVNFKLSDRIALYVDGSASFIKSDKVDGIPNYNYEEIDGKPNLKPVGNNSFFTQISIGFVFDTGKDMGWVSGGKGGSSVKRTGRTTSYFPFYRQKSQRFH